MYLMPVHQTPDREWIEMHDYEPTDDMDPGVPDPATRNLSFEIFALHATEALLADAQIGDCE